MTNHWPLLAILRIHGKHIRYIAVSFVGPSCGKLILRLKHRATGPDTTLTALGKSFTLAIPESLTIDDISLHATSDLSSSFRSCPAPEITWFFELL
jgi:hypothetical protein